jgi:phosphopentomutase
LKQKVYRIIRENRHFTISEVYEQCLEVSRTVVYETVTEHLQYRKIGARWVKQPFGMRRA